MREHKIELIHQILILDGERGKLPKFVEANVEAIKRVYPDAKYKLWNSRAIRKFLRNNFPKPVLTAYESLLPYAYKADLVKYALLYVYGGLYVDIGVLLLKPWRIPYNKDVAAFKDPAFVSPSWSALQTGLLWALPKREEFRVAIEGIVHNCNKKYYGLNPLYPTGPVLLGKAFLSVMVARGDTPRADSQCIGQTRCITPQADVVNMTYVSREGVVVAVRNKKVGGDLKHIGFKSSNNYNEFWHSRQVYGEGKMEWLANDPLIFVEGSLGKDKERGIVSIKGGAGSTYGPYVLLKGGEYTISLIFEEQASFKGMKLRLMSDYSSIERKSYVFSDEDMNSSRVVFPFIVEKEWQKVEFKLDVLSDFSGSIRAFVLEKKGIVASPVAKRNNNFDRISKIFSILFGRG